LKIEPVKKAAALMREAMSHLSGGPLEFYLEEMAACYDLLLERFAPFKDGDRVELAVTPDFDTAPGWTCCKHFLVKGAKGYVREATCGKGGFRFGVVFDDDTWIDQQGRKRPSEPKGMFIFDEESLRTCHKRASSTSTKGGS
jgi:hypothetical protein